MTILPSIEGIQCDNVVAKKRAITEQKTVVLASPDSFSLPTSLQNVSSGFSGRPITIFVHGTRLIPIARNFLYSVPYGLLPVQDIQLSANLLYKLLIRLPMADAEFCPLENFYIFTWSGALSFEERQREGAKLHDALNNLVQKYKIAGVPVPPITIIAHSHGGNVVLNLVAADCQHNYTIARLILLACPVQLETESYIQHSLFERVYSFYSNTDLIQIADPQGLYKNRVYRGRRYLKFSGRRFECDSRIKQVCIEYNNRNLFHIEFIWGKFWYYIPQVISILDSWDSYDNSENVDCTFLLKLKT